MIKSKIHNDIFVKKVETMTDLFQWDNALNMGFPNLPTESILLDDTLVAQYAGFQNKAYLHHATIFRKFNKIFYACSVHDYDEDAAGKYTGLFVSDNNGVSWTDLGAVCPSMATMGAYASTTASQWTYPTLFLDLPSGFYLLINGCGGIVSGVNYLPLGTLIRKINPDNSFGDLQWVNNGSGSSSRVVPTPISGFPSYDFASEDLINEVTTYISQKGYRPKILFGWSEIWETQETHFVDASVITEPTEIRPYNYPFDKSLHFWKSNTRDYNVIQDTDDTGTQVLSDIPIYKGSPVMRLLNYSPEIIVFVCPTFATNRTELMLCIARKNNETGVYHIADGDAYNVTTITKSAPVYSGVNKIGGEQLPFIFLNGKNKLDIAFSVSKEELYFKTVDLSKLI